MIIVLICLLASSLALNFGNLVRQNDFIPTMNVTKVLAHPHFHVDRVSVEGNHTFIARSFEDKLGAVHRENIEIVTIEEKYTEFEGIDDYLDDLTLPGEFIEEESSETAFIDTCRVIESKDTRVKRYCDYERCCTLVDNNYCLFGTSEGKLYFQVGFKYYLCKMCPDRIRFRFRARMPGVYVLRFVTRKGSYVLVLRTYKKFQVVSFLWPRTVHLGRGFKVFLMVYPDSKCSLFDYSFSWSCLDAAKVLDGSVSSCDGDFGVIMRMKNVVLVEQMSVLNVCRFVKVGSCTFI
ncbi:uncharacterized protein LOC132198358 [Neocloeon triangulifer]|uniref:uncharacterized protein LOC132198358 n=1 Tax=Neocloeon triangulifer TaxID=2078957 RepID=UPI00286F96CF|nr:uncharacterized protein LOC132198358 [Neocloeon triangulifer]